MKRSVRPSTSALQHAAGVLSQAPGPRWSMRALHHGARVLLLVATAIVVYLFFPAPRVPDTVVLERGVVAPHDVIAEFGFPVPKSDAELAQERAEAERGVNPVLDFHPGAQDTVIAGVRSFFAAVDSIVQTSPPEIERELLRSFMEQSRLLPTTGVVNVLVEPASRRAVQQATERAISEFMPLGVTAPGVATDAAGQYSVRTGAGESRLVPADSLLTPDRFFRHASEYLPGTLGPDASELQRLLLIRFFHPTLVFNAAETEAARARAREAVEPIREWVLQGERIVGAHERIREAEEERLRAYQVVLTARGLTENGQFTAASVVGSILYNTLVIGILGLLLLLFRRPLYHDFRVALLFAVLVITVAGGAAVVAEFGLPPEAIPAAFATLIVAALWDGRLGLVVGLVIALLIGGQAPFLGVGAPFSVALGGAAAAFAVRVVHRRSQTWVFIAIISLAYAAAAITMGLMRAREITEIFGAIGWGVVNAILASLLAIGFLPLLEWFARVTTEQTLLELADLNRRILKRLSLEASGTYHHTINVANLTEAACHAIGANGLLGRVGAYYHDIGKLIKPHFFIENQPRGRNPHDKLKPSVSAAIIRNHVTEGLRMADQEKLPKIVKDFIAEHHGTQTISFFYDRACELDPDAPPSAAEFSYPGPKPQTRETTVIMIADSVESAARVLQDPTPARIRELVERITAGKIAAGQLDESPLTLRDIEIVKDQFVNVLSGMYHQRIDYPSMPSPSEIPHAEVPVGATDPAPAA